MTNLPTIDELRAMATKLRQTWQHMPADQQPHAKNLIEQIDNYVKHPELREGLAPMMRMALRDYADARPPMNGHQ